LNGARLADVACVCEASGVIVPLDGDEAFSNSSYICPRFSPSASFDYKQQAYADILSQIHYALRAARLLRAAPAAGSNVSTQPQKVEHIPMARGVARVAEGLRPEADLLLCGVVCCC
jgi:hypothetical protein